MLARGTPGYPLRLDVLSDPPERLFVRGALPDPARRTVAIVGARRSTSDGLDVATRLARALAAAGVVVVSGGALGIDAAAHEGALAGGGPTVVVLPTSLDAPYPRRNRPLFARIVAAGGALLAEEETAGPVARWRFVARNRLIAALADVVVVVEARARSGTAATAALARKLGRPVAAVPWRPTDEAGHGCLELLRAGAIAVRDAPDVLAILEPARRPARRPPPDTSTITGVLAARGPQRVEAIAALVGRPVADVLCELTTLELDGRVIPEPGGRYRGV